MPRSSLWLLALLAGSALGAASPAHAMPGRPPAAPLAAEGREAKHRRGRPKVVLDELRFPEGVAGAAYFKKHLKKALTREARRARWGAGSKNRIEYRFYVTKLELAEKDSVLHVTCTAIGKLPKGKSAKSHLAFSGEPRKKNQLVRRVLEIVARGVITRLAELERVRRGDLKQSGVRAPRAVPED